MNKFIVIIALTIILKPVLPVMGYILNYSYIVKELCENRNNSVLNCNGKCQLKKELANASAQNDSNTPDRKVKITEHENLFINAVEYFWFSKVYFPKNTPDIYCNFYNYKNTSQVFRPPLTY